MSRRYGWPASRMWTRRGWHVRRRQVIPTGQRSKVIIGQLSEASPSNSVELPEFRLTQRTMRKRWKTGSERLPLKKQLVSIPIGPTRSSAFMSTALSQTVSETICGTGPGYLALRAESSGKGLIQLDDQERWLRDCLGRYRRTQSRDGEMLGDCRNFGANGFGFNFIRWSC